MCLLNAKNLLEDPHHNEQILKNKFRSVSSLAEFYISN